MTEQLKYTCMKKDHTQELRQYPTYIKAEIDLAGINYQQAILKGLGIRVGFIFGENSDTENITRTSPVLVVTSRTLAMTQPVMVPGER
jgi:hypothetical protein